MCKIIVIPAIYHKYVDVIKAGSVEVRGLQLEEVPIRNKGQKDPNLEFYTFQPYVSDTVNNRIMYNYHIILCTYCLSNTLNFIN